MAGYQALSRAIQGAIQFAKESIAVYQTQEVANARLGAVVRATVADAWTSHQQLMDMAKQQAAATGHTYEEVQNMQSVLLGFTSITGKVFEEASEGLINMTAVMGGDLASAANQFGKALDTPATSLGTLSRYGFKFTEEQKKQVKQFEETGQHAKAQAIILDSMKAAFGSAAIAVNDAVRSQSAYIPEILENVRKKEFTKR
jgi:phage-related minor tail protein